MKNKIDQLKNQIDERKKKQKAKRKTIFRWIFQSVKKGSLKDSRINLESVQLFSYS